jgi:4-amino-4-deoxy-L-arabinose transferase-like glycosyltransferase
MNLLFTKIINWVNKNQKETFLLGLILVVGAFVRLYRIDQYMTFLGDEGRDVIIVRRIFTELHPPLIGPVTSIGNMYLGPLYYYFMAIPLLLFNFSPVGPAVAVALLGVATIFLVWHVAREWFGKFAAPVAAMFYALSPTVIIYSRSSWNPNIMPFFALLSVYSVWRVYRFNQLKWLIVLGISYAFVLQSHYLGLLLVPTLAILWALTFLKLHQQLDNETMKQFIKTSLLGIVIFLILMSPLVIFDARHGWNNFTAIKTFFTVRQSTVSIKPWNAIPQVWPLWQKIETRLVTGQSQPVGLVVSICVLVGLVLYITSLLRSSEVRKDRINKLKALALILSWLGFGLLGLGLYKQQVYDHYFGFMFPTPFLLVGALSQEIYERLDHFHTKLPVVEVLARLAFIGSIFFLVGVNVTGSPLKNPPNRQLQRSEAVARKIMDEAHGNKFNLAVIAERNYEGAYKYFLLLWDANVSDIDPQRYKETVADQLYVVCEMPPDKCDPTHNAKAEVSAFGWSKIENTWEVSGVTLYKLVHTS